MLYVLSINRRNFLFMSYFHSLSECACVPVTLSCTPGVVPVPPTMDQAMVGTVWRVVDRLPVHFNGMTSFLHRYHDQHEESWTTRKDDCHGVLGTYW